jgi:GntR family transcriptional regulator
VNAFNRREVSTLIQRNKAIPLYYQLETILRRKIFAGKYSREKSLPSEDTLATEYEVSRITVRQALSSLEQEGLVVRQRGRGTFVSAEVTPISPPKLTGSIEDLISMGVQTRTEVIDISWSEPPETVRRQLALEDSKVLRLEKVRHIEDNPFSHVLNYLPADIGERVPQDSVAIKPMLMILEEDLGMRADRATQTLEATVADAEVAVLLDIRIGDPLLKAERTVFDIQKKPIEYVSVLYRADKYSYTVNLKRKRNSRSGAWGSA